MCHTAPSLRHLLHCAGLGTGFAASVLQYWRYHEHMSAHSQSLLTPEQYLELERVAEFKSEYYGGRMYAMSGGTYPHSHIIANFTGAMFAALRKSPCVVSSNDLRVRVSPEGLYTYPDVIVTCEKPKFADGQNDTLLNPVLLAEVLSKSTESYDRGFKFRQYRKTESLQEYALVSQSAPLVEVYRRQSEGRWLLTTYEGLDAICRFDSVDCSVALADLYDKVRFEEDALPPRPPVT